MSDVELAQIDLLNAELSKERYGTVTDVVFKYEGKELVVFAFSTEHERINIYWSLSKNIVAGLRVDIKADILERAKHAYI